MIRRSSSGLPLSAWSRWVACLGMMAVVSALWAPVSMLAEEARTGGLGGVCSASAGSDRHTDPAPGATPHAAMHCDLCCTALLPLPRLPVSVIPSFPGPHVALADFPAHLATVVAGLPFSHGPPSIS
ncbi:MAG: DUF2946 family protein [Rhodoferax sp.]